MPVDVKKEALMAHTSSLSCSFDNWYQKLAYVNSKIIAQAINKSKL